MASVDIISFELTHRLNDLWNHILRGSVRACLIRLVTVKVSISFAIDNNDNPFCIQLCALMQNKWFANRKKVDVRGRMEEGNKNILISAS